MRSLRKRRVGSYAVALFGVTVGLGVVLTPVVQFMSSPSQPAAGPDAANDLTAPWPSLKFPSIFTGPNSSIDLLSIPVGSEVQSERRVVAPLFPTSEFQKASPDSSFSGGLLKQQQVATAHSAAGGVDERRASMKQATASASDTGTDRAGAAALPASDVTGADDLADNDPADETDNWITPGVQVQEQVERRRKSRRRTNVRILQIGDSHTAADFFTGELRRVLQERFGDGGVGYIEAGRPHPGLRHAALTITASQGWTYSSLQRSGAKEAFYLSGFNATARGSGETLIFSSDRKIPWDRLEIEALFGPTEGEIVVSMDGVRLFSESLRAEKPERRVLRATPQKDAGATSHKLTIQTTSDAPVTIGSVGIFNLQAGVSVSKVGFPGATVDILNRLGERILSDELKRIDPHIVIIAFGTNEGFDDNLDLTTWTAKYVEALRRVRAALPAAHLILVAPPAASRLSQSLCSSPVNLERVREKILQIAEQQMLLSWDWSRLMPEKCGAQGWASMIPRLMAGDLVHLTKAGYELSARQFAKVVALVVADIRKGRHAVPDN